MRMNWIAVAMWVSNTCCILQGGHSSPSFIDGCQSADGRFVITAESAALDGSKQGRAWTFQFKDTTTGVSTTLSKPPAVSSGQIYGHLFIAPGGETFALWNPLMLHANSGDAPAKALDGDRSTPEWKNQTAFTHRLTLYRKDGSVLKTLQLSDFLTDEEWQTVQSVFSRVHWLAEYEGLSYRKTPRPGYALYRISPDYSVLEFRIVAPKGRTPRTVRVSLTDGSFIDPAQVLPPERTPVRPFVGDDICPQSADVHPNEMKDSFIPSLDPVRTPGRFSKFVASSAAMPHEAAKSNNTKRADSPFEGVEFQHIKSGFKKLDTPAWQPEKAHWVFTDLTANETYLLKDSNVELLQKGAFRAKAGSDGALYGGTEAGLAVLKPGETLQILLAKSGGRSISLNDIAVSSRGKIYFSTLKDPDKGRLTCLDLATRSAAVAFDGEKELTLSNPNGVALSADEKFLYVGISSYSNRKQSGIYRFPLRDDGSLDVETGKAAKWADINSPDGIAVRADGTVFTTAGSLVVALSPEGKKMGELKIPKGSGTNLGFGGTDGRTLLVTTQDALYSASLPVKSVKKE